MAWVHLPARAPVPKVPEPRQTVPLTPVGDVPHSNPSRKCVWTSVFRTGFFTVTCLRGGRTFVTSIRRWFDFPLSIIRESCFLVDCERISCLLFCPLFHVKKILFSYHIPSIQFFLPLLLSLALHSAPLWNPLPFYLSLEKNGLLRDNNQTWQHKTW